MEISQDNENIHIYVIGSANPGWVVGYTPSGREMYHSLWPQTGIWTETITKSGLTESGNYCFFLYDDSSNIINGQSICATVNINKIISLDSVSWDSPTDMLSRMIYVITSNISGSGYLKVDDITDNMVIYPSGTATFHSHNSYDTRNAHTVCLDTYCKGIDRGTCIPNWVCRTPLDGYSHDINCGLPDQLDSRCKPASAIYYRCDNTTKKCVADSTITENKDGCTSAGQACTGVTQTWHYNDITNACLPQNDTSGFSTKTVCETAHNIGSIGLSDWLQKTICFDSENKYCLKNWALGTIVVGTFLLISKRG